MQNFISKQELLNLANKADISFNKIGLQAYKFHSFLKPEENLELQQIEKVCLDNGRTDGINTIQEGLVIRNTMSELDYLKESDDGYVFNRKVDNDRKTHIIYGFGCMDGQNPVKTIVYITDDIQQEYNLTLEEEKNPRYFRWFEPFIVLNRNDKADFIFDKPGNYKIYGMTCEVLGANMNG